MTKSTIPTKRKRKQKRKSKKPNTSRKITAATTRKKKKQRQKRNKRPLTLIMFRWLFILGIWAAVFLGAIMLWFAHDLPDITRSATFERRPSIILLSSSGREFARYGESKGQNVTIEDLPAYLPQAVIATEDRRFYSHPGIDLLGIARAMAINIYHGRFVQGGSTITQQLAKNLFLSHERKFTRKIKEAMLAIWLEQKLTKNEILSAYMNRVYLGSGTYGFEAAAQLYFGKSAKNVTLREAAVLAGLLKAPSRYSPHNNHKRALKRSNLVLKSMIEAGYIKKEAVKNEGIVISLPNKPGSDQRIARYFADWVVGNLEKTIGTPDMSMDIIVHTTLDLDLHKKSKKALVDAIDSSDEMSFVSQGAILVMQPDGAITTMIGGYDYSQSQFNRTVQSRRPPGSAFKPIIYLTALKQGWDIDDEITDAPITEGEYRPKNFADKYYGQVTLKTALAKSLNTATVQLCNEAGIGNVIRTAYDLGITSDLQRNLSLCLGSAGISMLEMGNVYTSFANDGFFTIPYAIKTITTPEGHILFERKTPKKYTRIIKRNNLHKLSSMLHEVTISGTGKAAAPATATTNKKAQNFPVYGKTGTSQDYRDAWFAGYSDKATAIIWLGNDDNSPMRSITGGGLPARIFSKVINAAGQSSKPIIYPAKTRYQGNNNFANLLGRLISSSNNSDNRHGFSKLND